MSSRLAGQTPLDVAVARGHVLCVHLLQIMGSGNPSRTRIRCLLSGL